MVWFQEIEIQNNIQLLKEILSRVICSECLCNFTSINLEDSQLTCSDDGMTVIFTTTVAYSSDSGDITATDMINTLQSWAAMNGAVKLTGVAASVSQIYISSCEISTNTTSFNISTSYYSLSTSSSFNAVAAGTFTGGLIAGIILAISVIIVYW